MAQGKKKYSLAEFFSGYFDNFGNMLLVNLFYCIPLAVFSGIMFAVFYFTKEMNLFGMFLLIPLMSPFTGGLMYVCRKLTVKSEISPFRDFIKGTVQNWKFFLVNGIVFYIVSAGLYITFSYFRENLDKPIVILYIILSLLKAVFFLFVELSLTVMAVSVELKISEMIKNSVMLVVGGIIHHLKALLSLLFVLSLITAVMMMSNSWTVFFIILGVVTVLFLPVMVAYICVYNSYQAVEKSVIMPYMEKQKQIREKNEREETKNNVTIEELEALSKGNKDEYVSLNGIMVKRGTVIKMLETKKSMKNEG